MVTCSSPKSESGVPEAKDVMMPDDPEESHLKGRDG